MKRIYTILMTMMLIVSAFAQHRYHINNVTQYSAEEIASGRHRIGSRTSAPLPCEGSPKIPVVLVQFSDKSFVSDTLLDKTIEHSDENVKKFYENFCNGSGKEGENYKNTIGSLAPVKEYFRQQSDGKFTPDFVVIGPVTLKESWKYYGKDTWTETVRSDGTIQISNVRKDVNLDKFYSEAISGATTLGVDWTQFDNNNDNIIDFVFFIYAGEGENAYGSAKDINDDNEADPDNKTSLEMAHLIWPSEQAARSSVGGKTFGGYGCSNEIYKNKTDGIGTMCHELSHGLGLPDMYDTNYKAFGLDYWGLMDAGEFCCLGRVPCCYSTYERDFMGWRSLETLTTAPQTLTLQPIETGGKGYKITNPSNSNEYYIFENRQKIDFDEYLGWVYSSFSKNYGANSGLLILHVDYNSTKWSSNTVNVNISHQNLTILPADDNLLASGNVGYTVEYCKSIRGDLYPGAQNVTSIEASRFKCFTGSNLPINITNIRQNEDLSITFDVNGGAPTVIEDIVTNSDITSNPSMYYDLSGRPVLEPTKGIYIKDGKKVFVK